LEFSYEGRATLQKNDDHQLDIVCVCIPLNVSISFSFDGFLLSSIITVLGSLGNAILLTRMNASKQRQRNEILAPFVDKNNSDGGVKAWMELGDKHPDFRYTI
jgi:hypothetical protein